MLKRSTDRKTANLASPNGKTAKIANAFGLASGREYSCPGQTEICGKVCYAGKLERLFPNMRNLMVSNFHFVRDNDLPTVVNALSGLIGDFERDCEKWGAEKKFRIHHDGDFFSREYAGAWAIVMQRHPDVQFWAYTRSFIPSVNVVDILADVDNLNLYLSVDDENRHLAKVIQDEYPNILIATMSDTFDSAAELMGNFSNRPGAACPELKGALPLIDQRGGACNTCNLCPIGKANIRFSTTGK